MKEIYIFGHRKPDTDSVTSAIALSFLKNELGFNTKPKILDNINKETEFVLKYFGVQEPEFLNDVKLQVGDLEYYKDCYIDQNKSIKEAYEYMKSNNITGVPLVDSNHKLLGLVTVKMLSNELINGDFIHLKTSYDNILKTLDGKEVLKFDDEIDGNIIAAAFKSSTILNDISVDNSNIMIVGDRNGVIEYVINNNVQLLILVGGHQLKEEHLELAKKNKVNIIVTEHDTFHTTKLIGISGYVKQLLSNERIEKIEPTQYYDDFVALSNKQGYNNYPIVSDNGRCLGLIRVTDIKGKHRKKVILIDHNESSQSAVGLEEAEILEIVDHHKIGDLTTNKPINFRNMIVGSSNTIVYLMYKESNIKIPKKIAGIMMAGILSDTICLTSPTTTDLDKEAVEELAKCVNIDFKEFSNKMFEAGTLLEGKTKEEILAEDLKIFPIDDNKIVISQVFTLNAKDVLKEKEEYIEIMEKMCQNKGYKTMIFCITDITSKGSYLLYNSKSEETLKEAFNLKSIEQGIYMADVVSRKKQIVPALMKYLQKI
ncbi:MAG: putative manganese-dependent inorganic diphosphatase [Clostridia bacterium]|nr:putative manganese-dependent inorganic diphosphatase [Clostridia bacterium]